MRRLALSCAVALVLAVLPQAVTAHDSGFGLVRYMPDGRLDTSFGSGGKVVIRASRSSFVANALGLQHDGKIVVAGMNSDIASGTIQLAVARYNSDGSSDATFAMDGLASTPVGDAGAEANAVALQPDGMIVLAGTAFSRTGPDESFVARFSPDGRLDENFGTAGITTTRVGADASGAAAVALQPDGHIVVAGTAFSNGPTDDDFAVVRYTSTGRLDPEFGSAGITTTDFGDGTSRVSLDRGAALLLQPDARIVVAGFTRGERASFAAARYNSDGRLDTTFGSGGKVQVSAAEPQVYSAVLENSGDIVVAGSAGASGTSGTQTAPFAVLRLHAGGKPDETFGSGGLVTTTIEGSRSGARAVVAQPDGKLISGGAKFGAPSASGDPVPDSGFALARFAADGSVDTSFGTDGKALTSLGDAGATPVALAVQPDGKILAAGLVFFQVAVPSGASAALGNPIVVIAAASAALALVVIGAIALALRRRRA